MKSRAIADVNEGIVLARVEIAAPPERVFRAISTDELAKWWGSTELYRTTKHTVDLRPGGAYRSEGVGADGSAFHVSGTIVEIDPPRRLVQTWEPSWQPGPRPNRSSARPRPKDAPLRTAEGPPTEGPPSTVTWMLEAIPTGTRLTVRHSGFADPASCEDHATGWERVLAWLGGYSSPAPKYFVCRLLPPRPTFMMDMTADERAIMMAHSQYWRGKLAEGIALAFGPVGGPHGGYGLGLFKASDEAALLALQAEDPAIKANAGFRYENSPMVTLVM